MADSENTPAEAPAKPAGKPPAKPAAKLVDPPAEVKASEPTREPTPEPPTPEPPAAAEPRYTVEGLRERAQSSFKVSPHAIAGAFFDADEDETFTIAEAEARIDGFLKREGN